jgi:hypothetical protein
MRSWDGTRRTRLTCSGGYGALELPEGPGLGIELDASKIDERREISFDES